MNLFLVSVIIGVGVAVIAWEIQLFVRVRRKERKALRFVRAANQALAPVMRELEEGILEISRWIERRMREIWKANELLANNFLDLFRD